MGIDALTEICVGLENAATNLTFDTNTDAIFKNLTDSIQLIVQELELLKSKYSNRL